MKAQINSTKKLEKRDLIIDTAAQLFSEFGFHEVNMDLVARKAGIAKGTIYNYFKSKEELYFAINETRLNRLITELEKKFREQANVLDDLKGFTIHLFMFLLKYRDFFLIFQRTRLKKQTLKSKNLEQLIAQLKEMLSRILKEGVEKKVFKKLDICFTSDLILGMIYSTVLRNIHHNIQDKVLIKERDKLFDFIKESVIAKVSSNPLDGKTILITRSLGQSDESANKLIELGAEVISLPTLKIVPPTSWSECDNAIKNFSEYDFIIFTSQNSVDWFLKRLDLFEKRDELRSKRIIVIGSKTEQRLIEENFQIYFKPQKFSSEGLVSELKEILTPGQKILLPQSEIGNDFIKIELEKIGVLVHRVPVYNVGIPELEDVAEQIKLLNEKEVDVLVFTSPSTFDNFLKLMRIDSPCDFFKDKIIAVIGPTTRKYIEGIGISVQIEPQTSTFEDLINSIIKFFEKR